MGRVNATAGCNITIKVNARRESVQGKLENKRLMMEMNKQCVNGELEHITKGNKNKRVGKVRETLEERKKESSR